MKEKKRKSQFFEATFLLANLNIDIALNMLFFTLNNIKINFVNCDLNSRLYTTTKVITIIK